VSRASLIARGQAAAEAGMRDTCVIRRVATSVTDQTTGVPARTYADVYSGRCRIQQRSTNATRVDVGQDSVLLLGVELQLPMSVTGLEVGDQVTITASADGDLIGRVYLVRDLFHKTEATARRVGVQERTG
jgi:hypothetical protein